MKKKLLKKQTILDDAFDLSLSDKEFREQLNIKCRKRCPSCKFDRTYEGRICPVCTNIRERQIEDLEQKILKIKAKAARDSIKYDDCGPLDVAHEMIVEIQKQIKVLKKRIKK